MRWFLLLLYFYHVDNDYRFPSSCYNHSMNGAWGCASWLCAHILLALFVRFLRHHKQADDSHGNISTSQTLWESINNNIKTDVS